jgi:WD40 repeat protein
MNLKTVESFERAEDIFISYAHEDTSFANILNLRLTQVGYIVWGDWQIPGAHDWREEIQNALEQVNAFIFVVTPNSADSVECHKEADYASQCKKRIIPILYRDIVEGDFSKLHPAVAQHQLIKFRSTDDFELSFQILTNAIQTDLDYARIHARLLQKALEWERGNHDESFLIGGKNLAAIRQKLLEHFDAEPKLSSLQTEFVFTSGKVESARYERENRRQRWGLIAIGSLLLLAFVGAILVQQLRLNKVETIKANIADSKTFDAGGRKFDALISALKARKIYASSTLSLSDLQEEVTSTLHNAIGFLREQNHVQKHERSITDLVASVDGRYLASADNGGNVILWRNDNGSSQICFAGNHTIEDLAFSPDSRVLASIGSEDVIRFCHTDGTPTTVLSRRHPEARGWEINFSRDGRFLASSDSKGYVVLRTAEGRFLKELLGVSNLSAGVKYFSFSDNSQLLASASTDGTVKIWTADGQLLHSLRAHKGAVKHLAFSPQSDLLVTVGEDRKIRLWTSQGKLLKTLNKHQDVVSRVVFSPDGQLFASSGYDKRVNIWQRDGSFVQTLGGLDAHRKIVDSLIFSPDSQLLITTSRDKTIKIWQKNGKFVETLRGHKDLVDRVVAIPKQQILTLASGGWDKTVRFWRIDNTLATKLSGHESTVSRIAFSRKDNYMASVDNDRTLKIWHDATEVPNLGQKKATAIEFHPTRTQLVSGNESGEVRLWDLRGQTWHPKLLGKQASTVLEVRFSPGGETVASAGELGEAWLWPNGRASIPLKGPQGHNSSANIMDICFSPDGKLVATADDGGHIKLWQSNGQYLKDLSGHRGAIYRIKFSPNGAFIAAVGHDGIVRFWLKDGTPLPIDASEQHTATAWNLDISPDSQWIASASSDNTVKLWQPSGRLRSILKGHEGEVRSVRFSPDGHFLASASTDNTVKIWKTDGTLVKTLEEHTAPVMVLGFSPSNELASADEDGNILLWRAWKWNIHQLFSHACLQINNYMVQHPQESGLCDRKP